MTPWLADPDVTLYHGDALDVLRKLPDESVHMCATSPPFYGLRDYGVDGQVGLEETPDEWVARLVAVFAEVRRVLRDDGTLWVECGDSYASSPPGNVRGVGETSGLHGAATSEKYRETLMAGHATKRSTVVAGLKPKDLIGQPWLLAFALRADGWYLRSEIIWHKLNPMPESVSDRPTKAHSTVFLLSKRPRYFFDADAIRTPYAYPDDALRRVMPDGWATGAGRHDVVDHSRRERGPDGRRQTTVTGRENSEQHRDGERWPNPAGANARSVWSIPTEPTPFAHFATWPQALVRRMILAGTSERGCCPECGAPWVRDTEADYDAEGRTTNGQKPRTVERRGFDVRMVRMSSTIGWSPSCECLASPALMAQAGKELVPVPVPCTVLDPFAGSGTTCLVARNLGRHAVGIELNEDYLRIAAERLQQLSLLAEGAT